MLTKWGFQACKKEPGVSQIHLSVATREVSCEAAQQPLAITQAGHREFFPLEMSTMNEETSPAGVCAVKR